MFTKNQLEYLARVQATDDWNCECFINVLNYYHKNPVDTFISEARLSEEEFNELMTILSKASIEDIWYLQMGLNYFNELLIWK